jgi:hypothetical protein
MNGPNEVRSSASWYDIVAGHPVNDDWALLVEQYVAALLNIEAGADDEGIIDAINDAAEILEDCDGWGESVFNRAKDLKETLKKFNNGETEVSLCAEKPCCVFGGWENWGDCSKKCGGGLSYRYQQCFCPAFTGGVADESWCLGTQAIESMPCNQQSCGEPVIINRLEETIPENKESTSENNLPIDTEVNFPEDQASMPIHPDESGTIHLEETLPENTESSPIEDCSWGDWSECSLDCGGIKWRDQICSCPEDTPDCQLLPQPRQYLNCDKSLSCIPKTGDTSCSWTNWGDWSDCSAECDGLRIRKQYCYCDNLAVIYDDTFCTGPPLTESESCNTDNCKTNIKPLSFWREKDHPWPIPESTKFECDRASDSVHSKMTWVEIINVGDFEVNDDPWIKLAREYIVAQLNIKNGNQISSELQQIISQTEWILRDCDNFSESDEKAANLLSQSLSESNSGHLPVYPLEEISNLISHNDATMKEPSSSFSPVVYVVIAVIAIAVLGALFMWRRNRARHIIIYEPEFELPDPDEEMLPSGIDLNQSSGTTGTIVYGEEDDEESHSYALGELDEVDL